MLVVDGGGGGEGGGGCLKFEGHVDELGLLHDGWLEVKGIISRQVVFIIISQILVLVRREGRAARGEGVGVRGFQGGVGGGAKVDGSKT